MVFLRKAARVVLLLAAVLLTGSGGALLGLCGPFTDTANDAFCSFVLEIFTLGITTGTTPTTFSPADNVSRLQMATFLSRTVDRVLRRTSRRAIAGQFWTPQDASALGLTTLPGTPSLLAYDGADLWTAILGSADVVRVSSSDGKILQTWTGAAGTYGIQVAMGKIISTGYSPVAPNPGRLYLIDPSQPAGAVTTIATDLGNVPFGIAFDGSRIWTANGAVGTGSVSIATPGPAPWTVTTVTTGFNQPFGILFDGSSIWVVDTPATKLFKLDSSGAILQTVTVGVNPGLPGFDGTNIWVPNQASGTVTVVRASTGSVLATLTGAPLGGRQAAFDGERMLITSFGLNTVSLWKAADLTFLGSLATGASTNPHGVCSDGLSFWVTLFGSGQLARF